MNGNQCRLWLDVASKGFDYAEGKNYGDDQIKKLVPKLMEYKNRLNQLPSKYNITKKQQTRREQNRFYAEKARLSKIIKANEQQVTNILQSVEILRLKHELAKAHAKLGSCDQSIDSE